MASALENYNELNTQLENTKALLDPRPVQTILFNTENGFIEKLQERIEAAGQQSEPGYRTGYMTPLRDNLKALIESLNELDEETNRVDIKKYVLMTLLINGALQFNEQLLKKPISILHSIGSDLFDSYRRSRDNFKITGSLTHKLSPVIGFLGRLPPLHFNEPRRLPFPRTMTVGYLHDGVGDELSRDFTVGAMGMTPGFITHPLLWGFMGHEIGGHYILGADARLLPELQSKIYNKLCSQYSRPPLHVLAPLWRFWTEEAASDVRGVFLLGPSAGIGTIFVHTALGPLFWGGEKKLNCKYRQDDWHPISILIPDLICGAVEQLDKLSESRRVRYVAQLEDIARHYSDQTKEVKFKKGAFVRDPDDRTNEEKFTLLTENIPLKDMKESARFVGGYIATVELDALGGHSLRDLATWSEDDEDMALAIAEEYLATPGGRAKIEVAGYAPTAMQLISGGILAAVRRPSRFDELNKTLFETFNHI